MSMKRANRRGMLLTELLVASAVGFVVLLAVSQVDVTRVYFMQELGRGARAESEAALALAHITRALQRADRVALLATGIQFRTPQGGAGADLDLPASYRWAQYKLVGSQIHFFDNIGAFGAGPACGVDFLFDQISGLTFAHADEAMPPPGGDPFAPALEDNNVLLITVSWDADPGPGVDTKSYTGEVTMRSGAYTGVTTGLAPAAVSNPNAGC